MSGSIGKVFELHLILSGVCLYSGRPYWRFGLKLESYRAPDVVVSNASFYFKGEIVSHAISHSAEQLVGTSLEFHQVSFFVILEKAQILPLGYWCSECPEKFLKSEKLPHWDR